MQRNTAISILLATTACSAQLVDRAPCAANTDCETVFGAGSVCLASGYCEPAESGPLVDGVSATKVRTVGIADLSGSLRDLGGGMRDGVLAALAAHNRDNPNGRQFEHVVRDDRYDPVASVSIVDEVTRDQGNGEGRFAFAILGSMGSPTSNAMLPTVNERQVPFFGTYSGATHLRRDPPDRIVWNTRASYRKEAETITTHLVVRDPDPIPPQNVFVFSQAPIDSPTDGQADASEDASGAGQTALDAYGFSGYLGVVDVLAEELGTQTAIPLGTYRATSTNTDIAEGFFFRWLAGLEARLPGPQVDPDDGRLYIGISMVPVASAATPFVVEVIDGMRQLRAGAKPDGLTTAEWDQVGSARKAELLTAEVVFASISPVGDQLAANLVAAGAGTYCTTEFPILVSQVVPFPAGGSAGAVNFRRDLAAWDVNLVPGFVNFEGWIAGRTFVEAVTATEGPLTVDSFVETLTSDRFEVELGTGAPISFSIDDHDGSNAVYGSRLTEACVYEEFAFSE